MRNLKKILALVLALVMSLSLMATAGAAETTVAETGSKYQTAIDVLKGIEVVKGDEKGDRPADPITRAEVAALLYRIATADVKDAQASIHTGQGFTDVNVNDWYAGYISYCYIAEIIKGNPNGTFEPDANINGYATLAMILRAMGYGKNGEFVGDGWEIRTASIAKQIGILNGISDTQLSGNATRELVFEILFRAILTDEVKFTALNPYNYESLGTTLGGRNFGLEKISGVVMANEWANLNDGAAGAKVLAAGTTQMELEDGTTRTLAVATDLDAVGLTYNAYIANGEGGAKKSLTMEKSDINVVAFNEGEAVGPKGTTLYDENRRQGSIADLADEEGLDLTSSTGYYIDYDQGWYKDCTSDYQISYVVNVNMASTTTNSPGVSLDEAEAKELITTKEHDDLVALIEKAYGEKEANFPANFVFSRSIRIGDAISETDLAIMESIFDLAGRYAANDPAVKGYTIGEVYVGTTQTKDYSDEMSWKAFKAEYLIDSKETVKFDYAEAGESLRVIDNNGDGDAEYVLKVTYTMDQVIGTFKDAPELQSFRVAAKYKDNNLYMPDELAVGNVVVWNEIDGKLSLWQAESVTETVRTKTFKDITVTTTDDNIYGQSGITNATGMDDLIMNMDEKVEYIMFKDRFGFIRAYTLAQGSQYALLTEMYPSGTQNWNYVRNTEWTAEMVIGEADPAEHKVVNMTGGKYDGSVFASNSVWTKSLRNYYRNEWNYLQPAVAHLGNPMGLARGYNAGSTYTDNEFHDYGWYTNNTWNRMVMEMNTTAGVTNPYGVFTYDTAWTFTNDEGEVTSLEPAFSFTNVAAYVMDGEDVTLASAAKLAKNTNGEVYYYNVNALAAGATNDNTSRPAYGNRYVASEWATKGIKAYPTLKDAYDAGVLTPVYATDYVQLAKQDVKANTKHFDIHANYGSYYIANSNGYVNATVDTEFYIVTPDRITYKVGYGDLPTIKASQIRAAYAVADNTQAAANGLDYWVAKVIVIEVNKTESDWDSVSAVYYNPFETTGAIRYLNSLNSAWKTWQPDSEDKAILDVVPTVVENGVYGSQNWGDTSWTIGEYGFYALYNTKLDDSGDLTAGEAKKITTDWNKYGIYAGTIQRIYELTGSNYIDVDKEGRAYYDGVPLTGEQVEALNVQDIPVYRVTKTSASEITLSAVRYSDVKVGDPIIWVYEKGSTSKVSYIIDLAEVTNSYSTAVGNYPTWLKNGLNGDYDNIIAYQKLLGLDALNVTVLTDGTETAVVNNTIKTNAGAGKVETAGKVATITIPEGATTVEFTVTTGGGLTADDLILAIDNRWVVFDRADSGNTCTVTLIRKTSLEVKASAVTGDPVSTLVGDNTILTVDYLNNVIVARITSLTTQYATASDADKAVIAKELNGIKESLELLQTPHAVTDTTAQGTVTAQISAIEDVVGEGAEPNEGEDAAAKALTDAYTAYISLPGAALPSQVTAALDALMTAAVAYEEYYTEDGTADADVAYAATVGDIDDAVKAVMNATVTDLTNIKTAVAAVDDAKPYAKGLALASWNTAAVGSAADVTAYNTKVTTINGKANLLTLAKNLVSTYNAWYASTTAGGGEGGATGTASLWTAYKAAYDAVNALTTDKDLITGDNTITATVLGATGTGTTTPKTAWDAYAAGNALQPKAAVVTGLEVVAGKYAVLNGTVLTVPAGTTVDEAWVKANLKASTGSSFFKPDDSDPTSNPPVEVTDGSLAKGVTIAVDSTAKTITLTFKGNPDETANNVTKTLTYAVADAEFSVNQVKAGIEAAVKAVTTANAAESQYAAIVTAIESELETAAQTAAATAWKVTADVTFNAPLTDRFDALGDDASAPITGTVTVALTFNSGTAGAAGTIDVGSMTVIFTNAA